CACASLDTRSKASTTSPSSSGASAGASLPCAGNDNTLVGSSLPRQRWFSMRNSVSSPSTMLSSPRRGNGVAAPASAARAATVQSVSTSLSAWRQAPQGSTRSMARTPPGSGSSVFIALLGSRAGRGPRRCGAGSAAAIALIISVDDARDQAMAHDIFLAELDDGDAFDAVERVERVAQARLHARRQIDLREVAGHRHARILAEPCQEHLHLHRRRVLRFVENDKGVGERAPTHERQRRDLDLAAGEALHHLVAGQHVVQRIVKRPQIGIDLLAKIAGEKAQALAGLDRGARQHDALDRTTHHHVDGGGDGEIGLAGAGGPQAEDELMLAQRTDIGGLIGAPRRDAPLARADLIALAPERCAAAARAVGGKADCGIDRRAIDVEAALQAIVERAERRARNVGARGRAGDGDAVAARDNGDAELALDALEILIALAEELRQQRVVVELHLHAAALGIARFVAGAHASASAVAKAAAS